MECAAICLKHGPESGGGPSPVPGVFIYRQNAPSEPMNTVYSASIILPIQGRKRALVGDETYIYDRDNYLVTSVPLPVASQILVASADEPFLSLAVMFEIEAVREIMAQAGDILAPATSEPPQRGLASCPVTEPIRSLTHRIIQLFDSPDAKFVGELAKRELLYHVLKGPRGGFLRAMAMGHGHQRAIGDVLSTIHQNCAQPFTVAELAEKAGMSESVFFEAFKAVTAATPIQYIKRLRLQEAHRQLTMGLTNVSEAGYGVGYNSLSQFSREFTRVFGANPSEFLGGDR